MGDESPPSVPPELQILLDLNLTVQGLKSPVDHQKLEAALLDAPGIESVSFSESTVGIRYDPEKITKARFVEMIDAAGFSISDAAIAPPAPTIAEPGKESPAG